MRNEKHMFIAGKLEIYCQTSEGAFFLVTSASDGNKCLKLDLVLPGLLGEPEAAFWRGKRGGRLASGGDTTATAFEGGVDTKTFRFAAAMRKS